MTVQWTIASREGGSAENPSPHLPLPLLIFLSLISSPCSLMHRCCYDESKLLCLCLPVASMDDLPSRIDTGRSALVLCVQYIHLPFLQGGCITRGQGVSLNLKENMFEESLRFHSPLSYSNDMFSSHRGGCSPNEKHCKMPTLSINSV